MFKYIEKRFQINTHVVWLVPFDKQRSKGQQQITTWLQIKIRLTIILQDLDFPLIVLVTRKGMGWLYANRKYIAFKVFQIANLWHFLITFKVWSGGKPRGYGPKSQKEMIESQKRTRYLQYGEAKLTHLIYI